MPARVIVCLCVLITYILCAFAETCVEFEGKSSDAEQTFISSLRTTTTCLRVTVKRNGRAAWTVAPAPAQAAHQPNRLIRTTTSLLSCEFHVYDPPLPHPAPVSPYFLSDRNENLCERACLVCMLGFSTSDWFY